MHRIMRLERSFLDSLFEDGRESLQDLRARLPFQRAFLLRVFQQSDNGLVLGAVLKGDPEDPFEFLGGAGGPERFPRGRA